MESPTLSRGEFKFKYQKDPSFQALIDAGVGSKLSESGYCWAACIDMALSPFVPDQIRLQAIINAVRHERLSGGAFDSHGRLAPDRLNDFVSAMNEELSNQKLSARLHLIENQRLEDYHIELLKGRTVVYGIGGNDWGHMMIMDGVLVDEGTYFYSAWDPNISDPSQARKHFNNFDLYGQQSYSDIKHYPFLISIGEGKGMV